MFDVLKLQQSSFSAWQLRDLIAKHPNNVIIVPDLADAELLLEDLLFFARESKPCLFPEDSDDNDVSQKRIHCLMKVLNEPLSIVTTQDVLNESIAEPTKYQQNVLALRCTQDLQAWQLHSTLKAMNFLDVSIVESPGQVRLHGRTLDVFPSNSTLPLRIEFESGKIFNIKEFEVSNQRSMKELQRATIWPIKEIREASTSLKEVLQTKNYEVFNLEICDQDSQQNFQTNDELGAVKLVEHAPGKHPFLPVLKNYLLNSNRVAIVVESELRIERTKKILSQSGEQVQTYLDFQHWNSQINSPQLAIIQGKITSGFKLPQEKLILIAENELFPKHSVRSKEAIPSPSLKRLLSTLSLLEIGDYVVHEDYGRSIYQGLHKKTVANQTSEFIQLDYADSKLFLPVQKIGRIQKYISPHKNTPELDRLGSLKWKNTKAKVSKAVNLLAGDLLKLYAQRQAISGYKFDLYNSLDQEFADYFPYDETADQLTAINETLADLSSGKLMDRLICGDVGFGKTEVAMRAAFKCSMEGKQVAVLAPTTLLVEQHFKNFTSRFAPYPLKVAALSRFYSEAQNRKTLEQLASGEIDIIIGTHKLIQPKVKFKDLGLLVIDEEQRFGVRHKERLKQYQSKVHVLTLTATPIPRTLYMSLINVRDVSVISTAPSNRKLIKTNVCTNDDDLIKLAIQNELKRKGQVFFLHNQVKDIDLYTAKLRTLLPEARFCFAHGQMDEKQLERIMQEFINYEHDVLVTTTIIENGIDIPNANTLIVDRADCFGLAQLYQLRGRIGRSERLAYAYFLAPEKRKMTAEARERLAAIEAIDDLGQGFQLALRDLEIRGAGNVLGAQQSGNIFLIGYELYSKLLKEAVNNLKGLGEENLVEPEVKISAPAFIPEDYLHDPSERLITYQRLASQNSTEELYGVIDEIIDRFGKLPIEFNMYLLIVRLRLLLKQYKILELDIQLDKLILKPAENTQLSPELIIKACSDKPKHYRFSAKHNLTIFEELDLEDIEHIYRKVKDLLRRFSSQSQL